MSDIPGWSNQESSDLGDQVPDEFKKLIAPKENKEDPLEQMAFEKQFEQIAAGYTESKRQGINEEKGRMGVFFLSGSDTFRGFSEEDVPSYIERDYQPTRGKGVGIIHLGNILAQSVTSVENLLEATGLEHETVTAGGNHARVIVYLGK